MYLFELLLLLFSFFSDIHPGVELLDHMVVLFSVSWGTSILFSTMDAPTYIPVTYIPGGVFLTFHPISGESIIVPYCSSHSWCHELVMMFMKVHEPHVPSGVLSQDWSHDAPTRLGGHWYSSQILKLTVWTTGEQTHLISSRNSQNPGYISGMGWWWP